MAKAIDNVRARLDPPSEEALATYANLKARWNIIRRCEDESPAKRARAALIIRADFAAWSVFEQNWDGGYRDTAALSAQVSTLSRVQNRLRELGLSACVPEGEPDAAPDIEESTSHLEDAADIDDSVRELGIPENPLSLGQWWRKVPFGVKLAAGAGAGLWAIGKLARIFGR